MERFVGIIRYAFFFEDALFKYFSYLLKSNVVDQKTTFVVMAVGGVVAAAAAYFMKRRKDNNKPADQKQKEPGNW